MTLTIEDRLAGKSTGWDYLRICLAVSVVFLHSFVIVEGGWMLDAMANSIFHGLINSILPMFFALSGFLVAGSLERNNLLTFAALRALRIVPALAVEITLSALIIGPLFTTFALQAYFSDTSFYLYFTNIVGNLHVELPGVFLTNPTPRNVNLSLWTIPFELECYLALAALAVVFRRSRLFILGATVLFATYMTVNMLRHHKISFFYQPGDEHHFTGRALVLAFLCGVALYQWRDRVRYSDALGVASAAVGLVLASFYAFQYIAVIPFAYATVWIGLKQIPRSFLIDKGDYSYGIYLFAGPIQQMLATYEPLRFWWLNFAVGLCAAILYAMFSWRFVENPILSRKSKIVSALNRGVDGVKSRFLGWMRPAVETS